MYTDFWQLDQSPFAGQRQEHFFASGTHEEAFARLHFLIENRRRIGFLLGPAGTGKSMLLDLVAHQARAAGCEVARLNLLGLADREFIWKLCTQLGCVPSGEAGLPGWWSSIADRLAANRYQRVATVVLLDDADQADRSVQAAIARFALMEQQPESHLTIVLAAQPQRSHLLGDKLGDICDLRIDLEPWMVDETERYLEESLAQVGGRTGIFDDNAIRRIQQLSHGIPRRIRQLAELCLVAGAGEEIEAISEEIVDAVYRSLTSVGMSDAA